MQTTLNERVILAKAMASLSKIESRDNRKRVRTVLVPGSEATLNQVIIRRYDGGVFTAECRKCSSNAGYKDCKGNWAGVCRHSIAALIVAMQDQGYTPRFRKSEQGANYLARAKFDVALPSSNGKPAVLTLQSHQGNHAKLYFVAIEQAAVTFYTQHPIQLVTASQVNL